MRRLALTLTLVLLASGATPAADASEDGTASDDVSGGKGGFAAAALRFPLARTGFCLASSSDPTICR